MQIGSIRQSIKGKVRRFFLPKLYPDYVKKQMSLRQGECLQCGKCCLFLYKCPFLIGKGDTLRCMIYNLCRPQQCKIFPIDEKDLKEVKEICGYSFPKKITDEYRGSNKIS